MNERHITRMVTRQKLQFTCPEPQVVLYDSDGVAIGYPFGMLYYPNNWMHVVTREELNSDIRTLMLWSRKEGRNGKVHSSDGAVAAP